MGDIITILCGNIVIRTIQTISSFLGFCMAVAELYSNYSCKISYQSHKEVGFVSLKYTQLLHLIIFSKVLIFIDTLMKQTLKITIQTIWTVFFVCSKHYL